MRFGFSHERCPMPTDSRKVFLSHTSEFEHFPQEDSFISAAVNAVGRAEEIPSDMRYFTARDQEPAAYCEERVKACDVYVGIIGRRYGSPVRDRPEVSHTELEFEVATEAGLDRFIFLLDPDALVPAAFSQGEYWDRQEAFHERLRNSGATIQTFKTPDELEKLIYQALVETKRDDVETVSTGIGLLKALITAEPAVADAVARSKERIENTNRQVEKLNVLKTIHDGLHDIEFECLNPMRVGGAARRLRPIKISFAAGVRRIRDGIERRVLNPALHEDILDQLEYSNESMRRAVKAQHEGSDPDGQAFEEALSELSHLISSLPPKLDAGIVSTVAELDLDRLVELMAIVLKRFRPHHDYNEPGRYHDDNELTQFVNSIVALRRLRAELGNKAREHTHLQALDTKLRAVCLGHTGPGTLGSEWKRIKRVRTRLEKPFSPPLQDAEEDLAALESEIESAVAQSNDQAALNLLREYFRSMGSVFRVVDSNLKDLCQRLSQVSQPLETVLKMV